MKIDCKSSVRAERGDYLTAGNIQDWISAIPPEAQITQVISDMGSQRDPMPVLVGLIATWAEDR